MNSVFKHDHHIYASLLLGSVLLCVDASALVRLIKKRGGGWGRQTQCTRLLLLWGLGEVHCL